MTTKAKIIIAATFYCVSLAVIGCVQMYAIGLHLTPIRHRVGPLPPHVSLKGKYKVEPKKGECQICFEENIDVVKPFNCIHCICEKCLDTWDAQCAKSRKYKRDDLGHLKSVQCRATCGMCRAELREPDAKKH